MVKNYHTNGTIFAGESRGTVTMVVVDAVDAGATIHAGVASTLVNVYVEKERIGNCIVETTIEEKSMNYNISYLK